MGTSKHKQLATLTLSGKRDLSQDFRHARRSPVAAVWARFRVAAPIRGSVVLFASGLVVLLSAMAVACNIPVFRYALERWRPDNLELFVFYQGDSSPEPADSTSTDGSSANGSEAPSSKSAAKLLDKLRHRLPDAANIELKAVDVSAPLSPSAAKVWASMDQKPPLDAPLLVAQGRHLRGAFTCWSGSLDEIRSLLESPARKELARRILAGHSVVWVTILGDDPERNESVLELLKSECDRLAGQLQLPEGIGLPGSELYADVPLFLKFSTLPIERSDAQESFLLRLAAGFQPDAFAAGEPLVIPVFGRGRALEVIRADRADADLIKNITMFLCGACSCQVKDQNPGFDLLVASDWEQELYGDSGLPAPSASSIRPLESGARGSVQAPVLLTIPPGKSK